jgi:hypothetical protein
MFAVPESWPSGRKKNTQLSKLDLNPVTESGSVPLSWMPFEPVRLKMETDRVS